MLHIHITSDMQGQVWGVPEFSEGFRDGIDHACMYTCIHVFDMYLKDTSLAFLDLHVDVFSMRSGSESSLSLFITFTLTLV